MSNNPQSRKDDLTQPASSDVLTPAEAAEALGRSGVAWLLATGVLDGTRLPNGDKVVLRTSVEAEIWWQDNATRYQKVCRSVRHLVDLL